MKNSVVSILLPTYERPKWLRESLNSIGRQGKDVNLQVILMDNGSKDGETAKICKEYASKFKSCVYISKYDNSFDNIGSMYEFICGQYVVEFTDDDRMLPGNLARKVQALEAAPDADIAFSPVKVIDKDGKHDGVLKCRWDDPRSFGGLLVTSRMVMPSVMIRRRAFLPPPGGSHSIGGEWFRHLAILHGGGQVVALEEPLVELRVHEGTDTQNRGVRQGQFIGMHMKAWKYWISDIGYRPTISEWHEMFGVMSGLAREHYGEGEGYFHVMRALLDLKDKTDRPRKSAS